MKDKKFFIPRAQGELSMDDIINDRSCGTESAETGENKRSLNIPVIGLSELEAKSPNDFKSVLNAEVPIPSTGASVPSEEEGNYVEVMTPEAYLLQTATVQDAWKTGQFSSVNSQTTFADGLQGTVAYDVASPQTRMEAKAGEPFPQEHVAPAKRKGKRIALTVVAILAAFGIGYGLFAFFTAPKQQYATVKINNVGVTYQELERGDSITILGEQGDYYRASYKGTELLIEKSRARLDSEQAPEVWTGYAKAETPVFASGYLTGTPTGTLQANQAVNVVDSFAGIALIETTEGLKGYVAFEALSNVDSSQVQSQSYYGSSSYSYDYSYEEEDSTPAQEEPTQPTPQIGADGDDIQLIDYANQGSTTSAVFNLTEEGGVFAESDAQAARQYFRRVNDVTNNGGSAGSSGSAATSSTGQSASGSSSTATVFCDGCMTYLVLLNRGDTVKVLGEVSDTDEFVKVDVNGVEGKIARSFIRLESEKEFESYDGFALAGPYYADVALTAEAGTWNVNDSVKVVDEINGVLVIQLENGYVFVAADKVALTAQEIAQTTISEPSNTRNYANNQDDGDQPSADENTGGGSSESSSGGGQGAEQDSSQDWTQKKL